MKYETNQTLLLGNADEIAAKAAAVANQGKQIILLLF